MITFENDEQAYLDWNNSKEGFVLNTTTIPSNASLMLHRSSCPTINTIRPGNHTSPNYIKICSLNRQELTNYAFNRVGEPHTECDECAP